MDFVQFYYSEIPFRQALSYPPFSRIIQLKISGFDIEKVTAHAVLVGNLCKNFIDELTSFRSIGPSGYLTQKGLITKIK